MQKACIRIQQLISPGDGVALLSNYIALPKLSCVLKRFKMLQIRFKAASR